MLLLSLNTPKNDDSPPRSRISIGRANPCCVEGFVRLIGKLPDNVIARPADDAWLAGGWKHKFDNRLTAAVRADMPKTLFGPGI